MLSTQVRLFTCASIRTNRGLLAFLVVVPAVTISALLVGLHGFRLRRRQRNFGIRLCRSLGLVVLFIGIFSRLLGLRFVRLALFKARFECARIDRQRQVEGGKIHGRSLVVSSDSQRNVIGVVSNRVQLQRRRVAGRLEEIGRDAQAHEQLDALP